MSERKGFDRDFSRLLRFVVKHMPEDWRIEMVAVRDEVSVSLYDPDGKRVEVYDCEGDNIDLWIDHVNEARKASGLDEVSWDEAEQEVGR